MQALIFLDVGNIDEALIHIYSVERRSLINDLVGFLDNHAHGLQRLDRISPGSGFPTEHHGIGTIEDRGADISHLSPCWAGIPLHRVKHLRRHNARLALSVALLDHLKDCREDIAAKKILVRR